jgi:hypothetical protein
MEVTVRVFLNVKMVLESPFPDVLLTSVIITEILLERVKNDQQTSLYSITILSMESLILFMCSPSKIFTNFSLN